MTPTEIALLATFRTPAVRLDDICEKYFNLSLRRANYQASLQLLPVPTFRMSESRKAPRMVKISDLAKFLDERAEVGKKDWVASQV